jgi:hypothetical protein
MPKTPKIVEKIGAACHLAEVTEDVAKRAKSLGCPAFKAGNRIDWRELKKWCAANAEQLQITGDNLSLKDQKLNEEVRKLRRANDVAEGKLIAVATFEGEIRDMANAVQGVLNQLPSRFATELAGRTPPDIEQRSRVMIDEAIAKLSRGEAA